MGNDENARFYEQARIGLDTAVELDLEPVQVRLRGARTIDDVGAGSGRVVDGLLKRRQGSVIYALERNPRMADELWKRYKNNIKVVPVLMDVRGPLDIPSCDVALWLGDAMVEFSRDEQVLMMRRLLGAAKHSVIIDIPAGGAREYTVSARAGDKLHCYHPGNLQPYINGCRYEQFPHSSRRVLHIVDK